MKQYVDNVLRDIKKPHHSSYLALLMLKNVLEKIKTLKSKKNVEKIKKNVLKR